MTHRLSDKNLEQRKAVCSICGPVKIAKSGTGWACATKKKAHSRAWKLRHPDRDRRSTTEHVLLSRDPQNRIGLCAKDGSVDLVPWGRGFACGVRARQLGHVNHQSAPQQRCPDCWLLHRLTVWTTDGVCPRCVDVSLDGPLVPPAREGLPEGFHLVGGEDPYAMPDYESAVPGWHTLG